MASTCGGGIEGVACHIVPFIPIVGGWFDVGQHFAPKAINAAANSVLSGIANAMASAADGLLKTLSSFWLNINTPPLTAHDSPVAVIQNDTKWVATCAAIVCILIAAARMAISRRGEPATAMLMGLVRLVVVSAAGLFLVELAGKAADSLSSALMSTAHLGRAGWSGLISTAALASAFAAGDGMLLIIALLVIVSSLIQLMLMVLRIGLLVILTGTLPLAAAASMGDWGLPWWRKHIAWLAAWLLYKPAAALLYTGAFALTHANDSVPEVISGFMLLILAVLTLPALLRVVVPLTASLGAASSGSLAMGAAGALATGAIKTASLSAASRAAKAPTGSATVARDGGKPPSAPPPPGPAERAGESVSTPDLVARGGSDHDGGRRGSRGGRTSAETPPMSAGTGQTAGRSSVSGPPASKISDSEPSASGPGDSKQAVKDNTRSSSAGSGHGAADITAKATGSAAAPAKETAGPSAEAAGPSGANAADLGPGGEPGLIADGAYRNPDVSRTAGQASAPSIPPDNPGPNWPSGAIDPDDGHRPETGG